MKVSETTMEEVNCSNCALKDWCGFKEPEEPLIVCDYFIHDRWPWREQIASFNNSIKQDGFKNRRSFMIYLERGIH